MLPDTMTSLNALLERADVRAAHEHIHATDEKTLADQIGLTEIPAPPFGEEVRARHLADLLAEAGLVDVDQDAAGNVLALRPGTEDAAPLVLSAHLDTVFPTGTDVSVQHAGDVLRAPGISDDARGLAAVVAIARAVSRVGITTRLPILFAGTVGEEGSGDLRGVRHLFGEGGAASLAAGFISLDGAGMKYVVTRGLGARRFRVVLRGRGGHSWIDWGAPNPIHALGRAVGALATWPTPTDPPLSLTVARWGGGTSVNAIPEEAWADLDLRSESSNHLANGEERMRAVLERSVSEENSGTTDRSRHLEVEIKLVGHRPAGLTELESPLVVAALEATRASGVEPVTTVSSTDANLPMSLGIPAVTLGAGGSAGEVHTTGEWYRNDNGPLGIQRALHTLMLVAG
ncbi:MAG TPA: M20/M25/M40 family metallo-hydrolase [Gemmatimonadetes bacterium]|nr:M20/M25/M40 family metallo-hydrolase [Gemmatimonadota bacterium]